MISDKQASLYVKTAADLSPARMHIQHKMKPGADRLAPGSQILQRTSQPCAIFLREGVKKVFGYIVTCGDGAGFC